MGQEGQEGQEDRWIPRGGKVGGGQDEVQGAGRTIDWNVGLLAPHVGSLAPQIGRWLLMVWDTIGTVVWVAPLPRLPRWLLALCANTL